MNKRKHEQTPNTSSQEHQQHNSHASKVLLVQGLGPTKLTAEANSSGCSTGDRQLPRDPFCPMLTSSKAAASRPREVDVQCVLCWAVD